MTEGLTIRNIEVCRNGLPLLAVNAHVRPGDVLTLMGPSGSGKSTLLSAIMGDLAPAFRATGHVLLDGRDLTDLPPEARHIGILYQDPLLFPHLDVAANLAFGLPRGGTRKARRDTVTAALAEIGLQGY
ncbi:MAG: ATP-binding cassette domain-containing protein, partial [Jannaschia helgolandensis]